MSDVASRLAAPTGRLFVLTGAGMSVASGLPTYRGAGGLYPSGALIPLQAHHATSSRVAGLWDSLRDLSAQAAAAVPTRAHQLLADKANAGWDVLVATQNVDGLHHQVDVAPGVSYRVIDLHGSLRSARCLNPRCQRRAAAPTTSDDSHADGVHRCVCGSRLRPDVVLFGEGLNTDDLETARTAAGHADVALAIGTSLQVHPAAGLIEHALASGAAGAWLDLDPAGMLAELDPREAAAFAALERRAGPADSTLASLLS